MAISGSAALHVNAKFPTQPIEIPAQDGIAVVDDEAHDSPPRSSQASSLEEYLNNRRPSISFNPHVTLDSGHQRNINDPVDKPSKTRARGRSLLHAMAEEKARAQRAHSESDSTHYDPVTGQPLPRYNPTGEDAERLRPHIGESRHPLLQTTTDALARESQTDLTTSLTSESTLSPPVDDARTPTEYPLSPTSLSPVLFRPSTSYDDKPAWKRSVARRDGDKSPAVDFFTRAGSLRNQHRQTSNTSRRSSATKSPSSAASSFLRGFSLGNRENPDRPPSPDAEGQTVGEDYILGKKIGFGGFSVVKEATHMTYPGPQRKLAVKIVRKSLAGKTEVENEQAQAEFEHEVELWRYLNHPRILPLEAVYNTDHATFCFIPLNTGGTLFDLVRNNRSGLPFPLAKRYSYQLASALRYLHNDARVAHRDIKLENCLLDSTMDPSNVRLCDFGMAEWISRDSDDSSTSAPNSPHIYSADRPPHKAIGPSDTSTSAFAGGSLEYAAPEVLQATETWGDSDSSRLAVNPAADIWAFGVCVYAMVVGSRPFKHSFQPRVVMAILAGDWDRDVLDEKGGQDVLDLVDGCLTMAPDERWDIDSVMACRWLEEEARRGDEDENTNMDVWD